MDGDTLEPMSWVLFLSSGAFSLPHIDTGGFGTSISAVLGTKIFYLTRGHPEPDHEGWKISEEHWQAVVMVPGDEL